MTEKDKQKLIDRFKYACKGLDYEQAMVLGGIIGELIKLQDEENQRLQAELDAWKSSNAINVSEVERLGKLLGEIANVRECDDPSCKCDYFGCVELAREAREN